MKRKSEVREIDLENTNILEKKKKGFQMSLVLQQFKLCFFAF